MTSAVTPVAPARSLESSRSTRSWTGMRRPSGSATTRRTRAVSPIGPTRPSAVPGGAVRPSPEPPFDLGNRRPSRPGMADSRYRPAPRPRYGSRMQTPALRAPSILPIPSWRTLGVLRRSNAARLDIATLADLGVRVVMAVLAGVILTASATHAPPIRLDRSTPAWDRVTREMRAQGMGNCYHAAMTLAMNARSLGLENVSVVQGTLMGTGAIEGYRFGHAWVEADIPGTATRVVLDFSSGASLVTGSRHVPLHAAGAGCPRVRRLPGSDAREQRQRRTVDRRRPGRLARLTPSDVFTGRPLG